MSANEFKSKSDKKKQLDEDKPDFEFRTETAISLQPITKEISWNKKRENKLKDVYGGGSILSAKRQKLTAKKLEKEKFKTYNIKALW